MKEQKSVNEFEKLSNDSHLIHLKERFDHFIKGLDKIIFLINHIKNLEVENPDHQPFVDYIEFINSTYSSDKNTLENIISDSKLFLSEDIFNRFCVYCKYLVTNRIVKLNFAINNLPRFNKEEIEYIGEIYFQYIHIWIFSDFSERLNWQSNSYFLEDLCKYFKMLFKGYENNINELISIGSPNNIITAGKIEEDFEQSKTNNFIVNSTLKKCIEFLSMVDTLVSFNSSDRDPFYNKLNKFVFELKNEILLLKPDHIEMIKNRIEEISSRFIKFFEIFPTSDCIMDQDKMIFWLYFPLSNLNDIDFDNEYKMNEGKGMYIISKSNYNCLEEFKKNLYSLNSLRDYISKPKQEIIKIETKPKFKSDNIQQIFDLIKNYFSEVDQKILIEVLSTGTIPKTKLLFMGNGKTFLDFFKQLMKGQFITIAVQKEMENWISNSFEFYKDGERGIITPKYASKIISGNERAATGNRLIDVQRVNGKFEIIQLELTNRVQN